MKALCNVANQKGSVFLFVAGARPELWHPARAGGVRAAGCGPGAV